jgi:hypothetical protein
MFTLAIQVSGGVLQTKSYQAGTTLAQVKAELGVPNYTATLNGEPVGNDDAVSEGLLVLSSATKGA